LASQSIQIPTSARVPAYEDNKAAGKDWWEKEYFIYFNI